MNAQLTAAEERLLRLLREGGAVEPDELEDALEAFACAQEDGDEVALGPFLVARGVVSVTTVQDLLSEEPASKRSGRARGSPRRTSRREVVLTEPTGEANAHRKEPGKKEATKREPGSARKSSKHRQAEGQANARSAKSSDTGEVDTRALAAASRRTSKARRASSDTHGTAVVNVEGTRRFDPEALAAASATPAPRKTLLLPALAAGALAVIGLGVVILGGTGEPEGNTPSLATRGSRPADEVDPAKEAGLLLAEVEAQVHGLEAREDYLGALDLYRALPASVRAEQATLIAHAEGRLRGLAAFQKSAEGALELIEPFRRRRPTGLGDRRSLEQATAKVEALLDQASPEQRAAPVARRLRRALEELALARSDTPEPPPTVEGKGEPPERARAFDRLHAKAGKRLEETRAKLASERKQEETRRAAEQERAREATSKEPIDLRIGQRRILRARVVGLDDEGVRVQSEGKTIALPWKTLVAEAPELALRIRRLAVRPDDARDHLELGRWALEHRLWKPAQDAFVTAVTQDARYKKRVPDVTAIAIASRVFRGRLSRSTSASTLSVQDHFRLSAHNADWTPAGAAQGGVKEGGYELRGKGLIVSALKEVGWDGMLVANTSLGPHAKGSAPLLGLTVQAGSPGEVTYLIGHDVAKSEVLLLRREERGRTQVVERRPHRSAGHARLGIDARGARLALKIDGSQVFVRSLPPTWGRTRLLIGAASKGPGAASFDSVTVAGRVRRDWMRKAFGEFGDHLRAFLARTRDLELLARPQGRRPSEPLSAEDEFGLRGVGAEALALYRQGMSKLALGRPLDLLAATNAFAKAQAKAPRFAAALFRRGQALERLGQSALALAEYERAEAICPRFYESIAARARVLATRERLDEAQKAARAALRHRPDYAPALSALALIYFRRGALESARDRLDLALALDPWDEAVRSFRRNVLNVLRGPAWERPFVTETDHYLVLTDISRERGSDYAHQLEAIRASYQSFFGVQDPSDARKAKVLIFDTEEGFSSYAELSTADRVESLLGCYLPRYDQLLLYEDKDDATLTETRRVLYHEAFHQFIHSRIPELPYWVNEGLAEYFSSSTIVAGRVSERGAALPARLRDLRRHLAQKGPLPLRALTLESPSEFYSGPVAVKYAQAWSMVHFFLHGADESLRKRFRTYLDALLKGESPLRAHSQAFKDTDWAALERAWLEHVEGL